MIVQNHVLKYLNDIVNEKPDKTAYSDGTVSLTFRQVYEQSRSIGSFLYKKGIYKKPVVVFMQRAPKEIAAFFGVVAGGDFYVPVDEEMPAGRIQLILDNVQSPLVICDDTTQKKAESVDLKGGEIVLYDEMIRTEVDEEALKHIYECAIDTDPIYIVFTSGSTGVPKGVAACHRSVIDYIEQLSEVLADRKSVV